MTLSREEFQKLSFSHTYELHCDSEEVIKNLRLSLENSEKKLEKEENIKFDMACEIKQLKKHLTHSQQWNENQAIEIEQLKKEVSFLRACNSEKLDSLIVTSNHIKKLINQNKNYYDEIIKLQKEFSFLRAYNREKLDRMIVTKQLIIDFKGFTNVKLIDNSRVGITTPIKKADNDWRVLGGSAFSYPPLDQIIEVRPEGSFFSAPGKLMKWSNVDCVWHSLDSNNERNSWGEWRIAKDPWFDRHYKEAFKNRMLEVLTKTNEDVVVVHWYQKTESFNLVNEETMYITDIPVDFQKWRVFIK